MGDSNCKSYWRYRCRPEAIACTLANMWETCFCSASTLDECIKLGHGHLWISCWIVFQKFVVPWQWADFLHLRDMLKSRNRLYHWYEINLTEQTHIIVSTAAGSRSYHQWNSNLTGHVFGTLVHLLVKTWPTLAVSCQCNCKVTPSSRKVTPSSGNRELMLLVKVMVDMCKSY